MLTTTRRGISYPDPARSDRPDIPAHMGYLAAAIDTSVIYNQGTDSSRLAATHTTSGGRYWWTTDTSQLWYDDGTNWHNISTPQYLTMTAFNSLTPYDGQIVDLVADSTNGIIWRVRYNSSSSSTYKWEVLGGSCLGKYALVSGSSTSGAWADTTVSSQITLTRAGEYRVVLDAAVQGGEGGVSGN